jgi:hypothetical protein
MVTHTLTLPYSWIELPLYTRTCLILTFCHYVQMDNPSSTSADVESWTLVNYLEEGGFPALLWDTLKDFVDQERPSGRWMTAP